ncbi:MAG: hydantoinase/oxoprolinase family protein [Minwuiales bacterium]|nr:hydantoinase/oxoprolinase family protein [Minwuiales bacterium]
MSGRLGVDIGGTFTDVVRLDLATGALLSAKVATDYADPVGGIVAGKKQVSAEREAEALHHATTLATNAILEGKLPKGALLTTKGFRDVLDIGRIQRPVEGIYDFNIDNPEPLIPRALRREVAERVNARGDVVTPLDEDAVRAVARDLAQQGVKSVAICCLFGFVNPEHERRIAEIVASEMPDAEISLSSTVSPEIREFERASTTVIDALLKPILLPYVSRLEERLGGDGVEQVRIMLASGGLTAPALAGGQPAAMVNSGPAAGVLAAANLGRQMDLDDLVTIDMGGTSLDIGVIEGGRPVHKYEGKIAGYPLRLPMIDVAAVAAGGGSIAFVDRVGYIQVARESAGSDPGPACYGRGGEKPTITDADLILGRLGESFGGEGGFQLDRCAAEAAMRAEIAKPLEIGVDDAAAGVLDIIQARMAKAISANTLEKGLDVRGMPLVVYGGAGPTHGAELAEAMGMSRVVIPYLAGNFSAVGLLLCPLRRDISRMVLKPIDELEAVDLAFQIGALDREARAMLDAGGTDTADLTTGWIAHMRYAGQSYDLPVDLGEPWRGSLAPDVLDKLIARFHDLHQRRYAYRIEAETVELVQLRVSVVGSERDYPLPAAADEGDARQGEKRAVYFTAHGGRLEADVWDRRTLRDGWRVDGPALIEGEGSSALVPPGWRAETDKWRNLVMTRTGEA